MQTQWDLAWIRVVKVKYKSVGGERQCLLESQRRKRVFFIVVAM